MPIKKRTMCAIPHCNGNIFVMETEVELYKSATWRLWNSFSVQTSFAATPNCRELATVETFQQSNMSLLPKHIQNSCLVHFLLRVKAIYCRYRNHGTMTTFRTSSFKSLWSFYSGYLSVGEKQFTMSCWNGNSVTILTGTVSRIAQ